MLLVKKRKQSKPNKYPLKKDKVYLGAGINLLTEEMGRIYWEKPHYQAIVFGGSGSGKSELISRWTYEAILDDKQFFGIDPKGSKSWLENFFKACYRKDILYDKEKGPIVLTLPYPEISFKINPLYGMNAHQKAYTISSGIPEGKEPFFKNIAYEVVLAVSLGLEARGVKEIILSDIYNYLRVESLEELRNKILQEAKRNLDNYDLIQEALIAIDKIASYDPQYFPRVNSSLRTYLTRLITGNAGRILNVRAGNIIWRRLEKGNLRFFAFLNAEAMQQIAYDVGRLLFANLLTYTGMQSQKLLEIEPQLRVVVDEATEVGFSELNKAIRLVRERNVSVSIFTQSPSGFASAFGKDGKGMVIDIVNSCDLRIGLRLASTEDRKFMADMSPEIPKGQLMLHQNSMNLYYREAKLLKPFDFERLDRGFGYAFLDKTVYYFYSPLTSKYDDLNVKVVFTDKPQNENADIIVNLKDLSSAYPQVEYEKLDLKEFEKQIKEKEVGKLMSKNDGIYIEKQEKSIDSEKNLLVIFMQKIKENYGQNIPLEFKHIDIQQFYEDMKNFFRFYKDDFEKILSLFDLFKDIVSSVVGNTDNKLKKINLLDHSLRTTRNAYEKVKYEQDLSQEEKEIIILASLSHDIGKAFANIESYEKKDHERLTREILEKIKVNPIIIKLATAHHDKPESYSIEIAKLLVYVKTSDYEARQQEEQKVSINISKKLEQILDIEKLLNNLKLRIFDNEKVIINRGGNVLYIEKQSLLQFLSKLIKDRTIGIDEQLIKQIFPNSKWVRLTALQKNGALVINNKVFLEVPLVEPLEYDKNKPLAKKIHKIKIEELS